MAFAYGTLQTGFKSHKLRNTVILIVVAGSFYTVGILSKSAMAAYDRGRLDQACQSYVNLVVKGDLDEAYERSAPSIQEDQPKDVYKQVLGKLKTDTPKFNKDLKSVQVLENKTGSCTINVGGLPASGNERTDGIFNMGTVKNGRSWKVSSLSVE